MSDDDWDVDDVAPAAAPAVALPPKVSAKKWADEDADDKSDDDWDKSDDETPEPKAAAVPPPKKKGTLKQKLAEKERLAKEAKAKGVSVDDDDLMDHLTEQDRRRLAREKEQEADLAVASDLMGGLDVGGSSDNLKAVLNSRPSTKDDFTKLSQQVYAAILKKHETNPLFSHFVEQLAKDACAPLTAVQTRKVSSGLGVLGNTKQQEERDSKGGKKKASAKPKLGAATKTGGRDDMEAYDDVLADDDFM
ncbi:translation initiation factor 3 subunit J [Cryptococcus wingfieldii CBS 7118]|uniref:Eukaryotic translation initiation factor 3 subunit J n=1 Tax=Cryptococcus wingfieldii CBS 7118 TaxID=1295528 RepID=A0A1E3IW36_9TREE|nr:translation initiation factor 3 subunit J [Cryptococcus wingfieldii CBS 7118]ODN92768.1 translation initiation factor 3 subunit J [Cryptococcus wingfieldii CBS 7118]